MSLQERASGEPEVDLKCASQPLGEQTRGGGRAHPNQRREGGSENEGWFVLVAGGRSRRFARG